MQQKNTWHLFWGAVGVLLEKNKKRMPGARVVSFSLQKSSLYRRHLLSLVSLQPQMPTLTAINLPKCITAAVLELGRSLGWSLCLWHWTSLAPLMLTHRPRPAPLLCRPMGLQRHISTKWLVAGDCSNKKSLVNVFELSRTQATLVISSFSEGGPNSLKDFSHQRKLHYVPWCCTVG